MRKWNSERGATAVEYGLFVAFVAAVIIVSVSALGAGTTGLFTPVTTFFSTFMP
ncbi:MAG: Flp family type IVb pilin [Actinobacteria bacterium]|nr:Flp family type IVb pilin [Actinomycetota bacterium]